MSSRWRSEEAVTLLSSGCCPSGHLANGKFLVIRIRAKRRKCEMAIGFRRSQRLEKSHEKLPFSCLGAIGKQSSKAA